MKFSIIIPVYNTEKYIETCIKSVLSQTDPNYEIILVNDGTPDKAFEAAKSLLAGVQNVLYLEQENSGLGSARNTGIRSASGEYLVFLDSDDFLPEDALEQAEQYLKDQDYDVLINDFYEYFEENDKLEAKRLQLPFTKTKDGVKAFQACYRSKDCWFAAWNFMVNREYLIRNQLFFPPGLLHEDELWSLFLLLHAQNVIYSGTAAYCNTAGRPGGIIRSHNIEKEFHKLKMVQLIRTAMDQKIYDNRQKKAMRLKCASLVYGISGKLSQYRGDAGYKQLCTALKEELHYLRYGKYYAAYFAQLLIGRYR